MAKSQGQRGGRGTLTRERILGAALTIIEGEGIDALTMRRLATDLGVVPTAIYWHVRNREELRRGVLDLVMEGIELALPSPDGAWDDQLRKLCHTIRTEMSAHPFVFSLGDGRPTRSIGPVTTALVRLVRDAGHGEAASAEIAIMLLDYAVGTAYTRTHGDTSDESVARWVASGSATPSEVVEIMRFREHADRDAAFGRGLDLMIDGIRAGAPAQPDP